MLFPYPAFEKGFGSLYWDRNIAETQSAVAEALAAFGRIDILLICKSEALVGSVEELSQTERTQTLVRDQFETNFFGPVNVIKAVLPSMREKRNGHIVAVTGISELNLQDEI